jgi:hypothetical protein
MGGSLYWNNAAAPPQWTVMTQRHPHQGPPHTLHSLLEWRALLEMALLPTSWPLLMQAPRGDGHPVLLLPGFMADEATLAPLRWYLSYLGHDVQTWGFGRNVGFQRRHAAGAGAEDPPPAPRKRAHRQPGRLEPGRRVLAVRRA